MITTLLLDCLWGVVRARHARQVAADVANARAKFMVLSTTQLRHAKMEFAQAGFGDYAFEAVVTAGASGELEGLRGALRAAAAAEKVEIEALQALRSEVNIELNFPPKLRGARSRLYRRRFLQANTRWKALAEIYTMHSFAPLHRSLISKFSLKIAEFFAEFFAVFFQNFTNFARIFLNFRQI